MKKTSLTGPLRPVLFVALAISIPAFYLLLTGPTRHYRVLGALLYIGCAALIGIDLMAQRRRPPPRHDSGRNMGFDLVLLGGALLSAWPSTPPWALIEWMLRLGYCGIVFLRLSQLLVKWIAPRQLFQVLSIAVALLAIAGGGFYWLEPQVHTYADGLWLAFITGATVGYGDLVPSTSASRIFAVFIVLLGYAVFSVVTASISALFVNEDEKRFERELHADVRSLREEIAVLRDELQAAMATGKKNSIDQG